jgi:transcriptional regulator with XRE-family HTH domain
METLGMKEKGYTEHFATEEKPFHFTDSGLDNVYLIGIRYFVHEDGSVVAEIPAIKQLMKLIAKDLVFSPESLTGSEVRFLRKRMCKKAIDMAALLMIEPETLSRIENGHYEMSRNLDLILRLTYCFESDDGELAKTYNVVMKVVREKALEKEAQTKVKETTKVITMKIAEDNTWTELKQAA